MPGKTIDLMKAAESYNDKCVGQIFPSCLIILGDN